MNSKKYSKGVILSCLIYRWLSIFLLFSISLKGQERSLRFQHLTIEDGLAQNMVDCIHQDRLGFMWFGTWNGLCRYDGYDFEVFDKTKDGISNFIYVLNEDQYGNIWIGTKDGLFVYLYDQHIFKKVLEDQIWKSEKLTVNSILKKNQHLLVGTNKGVLEILVKDKNADFDIINHFSIEELSGDSRGGSVRSLLVDNSGLIWVGMDKGLTIIKEDGIIQTRFPISEEIPNGLSNDEILSLFQSQSGNIWVGTSFGLNLYHPDLQNFTSYYVDSDNPIIPHNTVMDINEDDNGRVIIATLGGLSIYDEKTGVARIYEQQPFQNQGLNNNFLNSIYKDVQGNIWIGTERGGVNMYNDKFAFIEHFEHQINNELGLNQPIVNSVLEDKDFIWIGTAGGGLNRYSKRKQKFEIFKSDINDSESISSNFITAIHEDKKGKLWVGTWGGGLNYAENLKQNELVFSQIELLEGVSENFAYISSIAEDKNGNLWIGTLGGLLFYERNTGKIIYDFIQGSNSISEVGCIWPGDDELWIGTRKGLYRILHPFQRNGQEAIKYVNDEKNPHSISGDYVISILEDENGYIWFGTYGNGVNKYDPESDTFTSWSKVDGMLNNIVYSIHEGKDGNIWMSTELGLSRLDPNSGNIRNFTSYDGLLNDQYYWAASYENDEGKLYFGGMRGMDGFDPVNFETFDHNPKVVITDLQIMNESVIPNKFYNKYRVIDQDISHEDKISLSYKEKIIGFEFSSLAFRDAKTLKYAFILEGLEKDWNYVSADRRYITYTNLDPGDYTFKVKVSDHNGEFNSPPTELKVNIAAPFWHTLWFQSLVLFSVIGLVFGYFRYRTYNLKRQKIQLERKVDERTVKIHRQNEKLEQQNWEIQVQRDELIDLTHKLKLISESRMNFFTNVSHEFRTPLTLIIEPLENLLQQDYKHKKEVKEAILTAHLGARKLLGLVNQILNVRRVEKLKLQLNVTKTNVNDFFGELYEGFHTLATLRKIDLSIEKKNIPLDVWIDEEKLGHIVYNLLSNAFKYTDVGGKIKITVKGEKGNINSTLNLNEEYSGDWIRIIIQDSGVGISEENQKLIFDRFFRVDSNDNQKIGGSGIGLSMTKDLVETHYGIINLESSLGKGSVFEVLIPVSKSAYNEDEIKDDSQKKIMISEKVSFLKDELVGNTEEDVILYQNIEHEGNLEHTVLVVEDNKSLRNLIVNRLKAHFNILEADDGREGIALAKKENPDIIISDVMMPYMDGLELCANVKSHLDTCHIPVVLLTAKSSVEDQIQGLEIGADDYLPKPFNAKLLLTRINNLINSRKQLRAVYNLSEEVEPSLVTNNQRDQNFLEEATKIVKENIEFSDFKVNEFVRKMGVSRSLLHKKLVALTDLSTSEFINHFRLLRSIELLKEGDYNISEIAYSVGYKDPKYFSRVFSKQYGCSPSQYLGELQDEKVAD